MQADAFHRGEFMATSIARRSLMIATALAALPKLPQAAETGAPKPIIVIGATARSADDLIPQALWRGHWVVAVARRPQRIRYQNHPRLKLVKADVYDVDDMAKAFSGRGDEVVISVFGPRIDPNDEIPETDLMSKGTENVIGLMKKNGNKRLFVTSSAAVETVAGLGYTPTTPRPAGLTLANGLWYYNMRGPYNDMGKMEKIALASGLKAVVLRPGQLMVEPPRGDLRVKLDGDSPDRRLITYPDFAAMILDNLENDAFVGHIVNAYSDREMTLGENVDLNAELAKMRATLNQVKEDLAAEKR